MAALPGTTVDALNSRTESMGEYGVKSFVLAVDHRIADLDERLSNRRGRRESRATTLTAHRRSVRHSSHWPQPESFDDTTIAGTGALA